MPDIRINISLPKAFLKEVDKKAEQDMLSRSAYIRLALLEKMGLQNMHDMRPINPTSENEVHDLDYYLKKISEL